MTGRVFEDARSFEVFDQGSEVEVYVFDIETSYRGQGRVMITCRENAGYQSQNVNIVITPEEATLMKLFLIKQGY
jgi:hypothetical protein